MLRDLEKSQVKAVIEEVSPGLRDHFKICELTRPEQEMCSELLLSHRHGFGCFILFSFNTHPGSQYRTEDPVIILWGKEKRFICLENQASLWAAVAEKLIGDWQDLEKEHVFTYQPRDLGQITASLILGVLIFKMQIVIPTSQMRPQTGAGVNCAVEILWYFVFSR